MVSPKDSENDLKEDIQSRIDERLNKIRADSKIRSEQKIVWWPILCAMLIAGIGIFTIIFWEVNPIKPNDSTNMLVTKSIETWFNSQNQDNYAAYSGSTCEQVRNKPDFPSPIQFSQNMKKLHSTQGLITIRSVERLAITGSASNALISYDYTLKPKVKGYYQVNLDNQEGSWKVCKLTVIYKTPNSTAKEENAR